MHIPEHNQQTGGDRQ